VKRAALLIVFVLALAGCAHLQHSNAPTVRDQWDATLAKARIAADSGKYDAADQTLADFIAAHNGSHEATEAIFWRGLYKVDPNNKNGSLSAGISSLDVYLASDSAEWHKSVAKVLRRTAALAQTLKLAASPSQQPASTTPSPTSTSTADKDAMKSRDEEIASLREQLAKVNAELERIKKRLANPKA
jgi:TolA-binding protein